MKDEVYSTGSFLQSRHADAQLVCSDCHNPHAGTLRKPAVELCVTCHRQESYETKSHHLHQEKAEGIPNCVDCHMPERTYMNVDRRRDHSFSIPAPSLSEKIGAPSVCATCHADKTPLWAQISIEKVHGKASPDSFGAAFFADDEGDADAVTLLEKVFSDEKQADIVRATALVRWARWGREMKSLDTAVKTASESKSTLLRRSAAEAAEHLAEATGAPVLEGLLLDKERSVRVAAALSLLALPPAKKETTGWKLR
jgi:formate-dependent nitrite reductase cytochrome c552 subunit